VPRLKNGSRAVVVPQAKGGRASHGPNPHRIYTEKINDKERLKAIRSAVAATINPELVKARGYKYEGPFPVVVDDEIQSLNKTSEVVDVLAAMGFEADLIRASEKQVRAGRGKTRAILQEEDRSPAGHRRGQWHGRAANIPGMDVATIDELNAEMLAPGTHAGRLTSGPKAQ
jgi:large subunit ribosomal protein L4e